MVDTTMDLNIHHQTGWLTGRLVLYMTVVGLSLGLFGYDNSFASPLVQLPLFIEKYQGPGPSFTARNLDLLVSVPLVGAAMGTFLAAPLLERIGRKRTFMLAYLFLCAPGSFLQLFAPNLGALVVGRAWNNVGISVLTTAAPLYVSELAPAHVRGRAIGFCVAGIAAVGIIATVVVWGSEKINDNRQYKIPLAIQAACPVTLLFLTLLCPESPVWEVQHGKKDSARRTLMVIRANRFDAVEAELASHELAIAQAAELQKEVRFWDILNRANLQRTLTAGATLSLAQVGGQILVTTYSTVILVQSGVANAFQVTVIITCLQFLGTLVGPVLLDKVGRRPVALFGFSMLFFLNIAAGGLAAGGLKTKPQTLGLAAVFITFGFFNSASFQPLGLVLPAEVATPALREPTLAWSVFWSYVTAVVTTFVVPQLTSADAANLGAKTAFIFAGCVFLSVIWAYFFMPETKARTMAEVDEMYAVKLPMRKWRNYQCVGIVSAEDKMKKGGRASRDEVHKEVQV